MLGTNGHSIPMIGELNIRKNSFTPLEVKVLFNCNLYKGKYLNDNTLFYRKVCVIEIQIEMFKNVEVFEDSSRNDTGFCYLCLENTTKTSMNSV